MARRVLPLVGLLAIWFIGDARAQIPQVVQLPTFEYFSVSTTVSVPDSGRAFLGGIDRAQYGRISRGFPLVNKLPGAGRLAGSRATGSSVGTSRASVSATIIDHDELDRRTLSAAAASRRGTPLVLNETDRKAAFLSSHVGNRESDTALMLTASAPPAPQRDIREEVASAERKRSAEIEALFARARKAEEAGRLGAARCCYEAIGRRGAESQRREARIRMASLEAREKAIALAARKR